MRSMLMLAVMSALVAALPIPSTTTQSSLYPRDLKCPPRPDRTSSFLRPLSDEQFARVVQDWTTQCEFLLFLNARHPDYVAWAEAGRFGRFGDGSKTWSQVMDEYMAEWRAEGGSA